MTITPGSEYAPAAPWYTHSNCIQMHGSTFAGNLMTPMLIHSAGADRLTIGIYLRTTPAGTTLIRK